mgnify:CR=1 FL=1
MIILGTSGSGKSTAAKLLLRSHIRNGYQIVIIDPEDEFREIYGLDVVTIPTNTRKTTMSLLTNQRQ